MSANAIGPVTMVNGFPCRDCTDIDNAKKHVDPAHPNWGPYDITAPASVKLKQGVHPIAPFALANGASRGGIAGSDPTGGVQTGVISPSAAGQLLSVTV